MRKYSRYFETENDYNSARTNNYVEPWVSATHIQDSYRIDFNKDKKFYTQEYLTFVFLEDGGSISGKYDFYYSKDNGQTWNTEGFDNLLAGDRVLVKGDVKRFDDTNGFEVFYVDGKNNVEGNVFSIYDSANFRTRTAFDTLGSFNYMFSDITGLTSAKNLILPATALTVGCYYNMFNGCYNLSSIPELPATTLAESCYDSMFYGCSSLTTVPSNYLPATTLTGWCYNSMFYGCTGLTTAPELPATTLAESCYSQMFRNCTSLNYIKCLATNISASNCTSNWVNGVQTNSGTFVRPAAAASLWGTGVNGIPTNWTAQNS